MRWPGLIHMKRLLMLFICVLFLFPEEVLVSGVTRESITAKYYRLTMETARKSFEPNPVTGETGEQAYHDEASKQFKQKLNALKGFVTPAVDKLAKRITQRTKLIKYDPTLSLVDTYNRQELMRKQVDKCRVELVFWDLERI